MIVAGLTQVLGMGWRPRRWERPLLFFAALCATDFMWLILAPSLTRRAPDAGYSIELFNVPSAWEWLDILLADVLLALLAALIFGLVRNVIAIPVLAAAYALLWTGLTYLISLTLLPADFRDARPFWDAYRVLFLVRSFLWPLVFFSALELALRVLRELWLALLLGAVLTPLIMFPLNLLLSKLVLGASSDISASLLLLPFNIIGQVLFAVTLWGGLRLTAGPRPLDQIPYEPRVSSGFYVGTLAATQGVTLFLGLAIFIILRFTKVWEVRALRDLTPVFLLLVLLVMLAAYGVVVFLLLVHKMWATIQDGYVRTTPGWAVGGLFIPFYNLYWMFQVFPGFVTDYYAFAWRHRLYVPRLSKDLFTAYVIICLVAVLPYIDLLVVPAGYVLLLVMVSQICRAINAVPFAPPPLPG